MSTLSDDVILQQLRQPNTVERGFRALMDKYQERLYYHIRRMVTDHEDANDVLQNTFIKVYRHIGQFKGEAQLYTWMYRIATNETLSFLDKRRRRQAASLDDEESTLSNRLTADEYFDGEAAKLQLQIAIAELPEKQRLVFNLRYFDEMPYKEMSQVLDTSVGALKASYFHAVKKIEAHMRNVAL